MFALMMLEHLRAEAPQEKSSGCSHDDATTPVEHFGQYTNFNLHRPIKSGMNQRWLICFSTSNCWFRHLMKNYYMMKKRLASISISGIICAVLQKSV
jgi:hypothetical protein